MTGVAVAGAGAVVAGTAGFEGGSVAVAGLTTAAPGAPETGVTRFVAAVLVLVACLGTTRYALANATHEAHDTLVWRYLALSTTVGGVYAALLIAELVTPDTDPILRAFRLLAQLFFVVFFALSLRELYYAQPSTSDEGDRLSLSTARRVETGLMLLAVVQFPIVVVAGPAGVARAILGVAAAAFTIYGVSFGQALRARRLTHGTVIDVTVTYTTAVLLCVGAVTLVESAVVLVAPQAAVDGAVNVLLVMIGSFLISLIIRLKRSASAAGGMAG
jgi:hypothetical protein